MIRANAALTRQIQDFFHRHLVGIYRWDDVEFAPPERNEKPVAQRNSRGRMRRAERPEGKFHAIVRIEFSIWRLTVEGPNEHPPLGWLELDGHGTVEGPLDSATWDRAGALIKKKHEEFQNVA